MVSTVQGYHHIFFSVHSRPTGHQGVDHGWDEWWSLQGNNSFVDSQFLTRWIMRTGCDVAVHGPNHDEHCVQF